MRFSLNLLVVALFLVLAVAVEATPLGRRAAAKAATKDSNNAAAAAKASKGSGNAAAAAAAASNSTATATSSNSTAASGTGTAASATRTRPCDQGDQSLAAGLQANTVVGIGEQAAVVTLQGLVTSNGAASDISDAMTRLTQFMSTSALQLQMATGIADDGSLAQPQLALLTTAQTSQQSLAKSLTGTASDNATLSTLLASFAASTGDSQDGANNALIDCFLPLTAVSG